jgi:hypothetical protein
MDNPLSISRNSPNPTKQTPTFEVQIVTNPTLPIKIAVDGHTVQVPGTILLTPGAHTFYADPQIQQLLTVYTFDQWIANATGMSYRNTATLMLTGPCTVTAQYMLGQSGITPAAPDSLPNPNGPMTPNLILINPGPTEGLPSNKEPVREV